MKPVSKKILTEDEKVSEEAAKLFCDIKNFPVDEVQALIDKRLTPSIELKHGYEMFLEETSGHRIDFIKKLEEMVDAASKTERFQKDIIRVREDLGIPKGGFLTADDAALWIKNNTTRYIHCNRVLNEEPFFNETWKENIFSIEQECRFIASNSRLAYASYPIIIDYVVYEGKVKWALPNYEIFYCGPRNTDRQQFDTSISVNILISEQSTIDDVKDFIDSNWSEMMPSKTYSGIVRNKNNLLNFDINDFIKEKYLCSKDTLVGECEKISKYIVCRGTGISKLNLISRLVHSEYNINLTSEAIRKRIQRDV